MSLFRDVEDRSIWTYVRVSLKFMILEIVLGVLMYIPLNMADSIIYQNRALGAVILLALLAAVFIVPGYLAYTFYDWE